MKSNSDLVTIIILTYNSDVKQIISTIESVIIQKHDNIEILICDDCSNINPLPQREIDEYFTLRGFFNYKIIVNSINLGTVKNILNGAMISNGDYIKPLGAGDMLYDENTLLSVIEHMKIEQSELLFGGLQSFYIDESLTVINRDFAAPKDIRPYLINNMKSASENMLLNGDWISGASIFYETNKLKELLTELSSLVKYCEDLSQILIALRGEIISYYPGNVVWYEYGSGISTSGSVSKRLLNDHESMDRHLLANFSENGVIKKLKIIRSLQAASFIPSFFRRVLVKLTKLILLPRTILLVKNRLYSPACLDKCQRIVNKTYHNDIS